jgi:hypothetical protein
MQLASAQLGPHLQKGLKSLYTIHGDEPLLAQEAADAIRAAARTQGYTERSSYTVAGAHFDWSAVLAAGGSLSLFADKQIVEIRIPSGKPGKDGSAARSMGSTWMLAPLFSKAENARDAPAAGQGHAHGRLVLGLGEQRREHPGRPHRTCRAAAMDCAAAGPAGPARDAGR